MCNANHQCVDANGESELNNLIEQFATYAYFYISLGPLLTILHSTSDAKNAVNGFVSWAQHSTSGVPNYGWILIGIVSLKVAIPIT